MKNGKLIKRVFRLVNKIDRGYMPVTFITKVLDVAPKYMTYIFTSYLIDSVMVHVALNEIIKTAAIYLACLATSELLHWGLEKYVIIHERIIREKMDLAILDKAFELDFEELERKETLDLIHKAKEGGQANGDVIAFCRIVARIIRDVSDIVFSAIILASLFVKTTVTGEGALFRFVASNWSFLVIPVCLVLSILFQMRTQKKMNAIQLSWFNANVDSNRKFNYFERLTQTQSIGQDIRIYGMADLLQKRVNGYLAISRKNMHKGIKDTNRLYIVSNAATFMFQIICNLYIGLKAIFGMISTGNFIKYVNTMIALGLAIGRLFEDWLQVDMVCSYLVYFAEFLDLDNKKYEGKEHIEARSADKADGASKAPVPAYEIEFRDVSFKYPSSDEMVLSHVNITMKSGEKMAFVGQNGAGKTTFIKLLCRLYDPTEGAIYLNGKDIREYDYKEYMAMFSVVFQDFQLMASTIAENIAIGTDYKEDEITDALVRAGMEERLGRLEDGINTNLYNLEKKGIEISGGEAQKIAIARALYKDAPFVIMDEPTSALDPIAEYDIYNRFNDLVQNKAAIYISHRMSSCRFCDTIYVFEKGRIIQHGSHDQLVADTDGLYCQMWTAQAKYYQKEETPAAE